MSDHDASRNPHSLAPADLLTPATAAVAGFVVAVVALLGQNAVTGAVSSLFGSSFGTGGELAYYVGWGVAILLQAGLAVLLCRAGLAATTGWHQVLARAGIVIAGLAALAGVVLIIGGVIQDATY